MVGHNSSYVNSLELQDAVNIFLRFNTFVSRFSSAEAGRKQARNVCSEVGSSDPKRMCHRINAGQTRNYGNI